MNGTRIALVTGANKGIGLEVARQLASRGVRVYVGARNREAGEKAAAQIGGDARFLQLDVTDPESIAEAARNVGSESGKLDVLVNNAGILLDSTGILELDADTLRKTLETNLLGPLRLAQAFAPLLRKSDAPRIVNVSSGGGQLSGELQSWAPAYCISKTALNSLTQQLAAALPEFVVNSVCPGWVRTDMGGASATRSVEEGADTITWLATDAPQSLRGKFIRDRQVIDW